MISSGDLSALIAKLEQDKLISSDEATTYRNALKIVSNYSSELGGSLGQNTTFKYLSSAATVTSPVTYPIHQTLEFDPSTGSQTVQLNIDGAKMGNLELEGVTKDSIEASIRQQLKDTGYHVTAAVSGNTIQVTFVNERTASTTPVASSEDQVLQMRMQVMQQHLQIPLLQVKVRHQRQLLHQKSVNQAMRHFLKR